MKSQAYPTILLIAALVAFGTASLAPSTRAGIHGCARCGCDHGCQKVCRLVSEEKKVNVICWGCKCEDFCAPGHSHRDCKHCEEVCEDCECGPDAVHTKPKPFVWYDWIPGCSKQIYTKKKLMKKTVEKKVPSFKWVVEDLCPRCLQRYEQAPPPPAGVPVPRPPLPNAKVVYTQPE
jgi:hypothetical protein